MKQTQRVRQELSRLRLRLRELLGELREVLAAAYERTPVRKGTVYELARRCGKPNCRCARGELHRSMVLSWSEGGRSRLESLKASQVDRARSQTQAYSRLRRARARVVKIGREMVEILDRIEALRREEPPDG
jgi:hypothetical protein